MTKLFKCDLASACLIKQTKTELVLLVEVSVVIDVHDCRELLKSDMAVSVRVRQPEDAVGKERVRGLAKEPEVLAELSQLHESCVLEFLNMTCRHLSIDASDVVDAVEIVL